MKAISAKTKYFIVLTLNLLLVLALLSIFVIAHTLHDNNNYAIEHNQRVTLDFDKALTAQEQQALIEAQNQAIEQTSEQGETEQTAAATSETAPSNPLISIVIYNLGLSKALTDIAINTSPAITLGFTPYATDLQDFSFRAKSSGHEILLNLPLEPMNYPYDDPGALGLISSLPNEENIGRLEKLVKLIDNFSGFYTSKDEKFSSQGDGLEKLFSYLRDKKLLMIYSGDFVQNIENASRKTSYKVVFSDIAIDKDPDINAIRKNLAMIEDLATKHGAVIATCNPYQITLNELNEWIKSLPDKNIQVVPISEIIKLYE